MSSDVGQTILVLVCVSYAAGVVMATKRTYASMVARGIQANVAIYYNRKIVHMAAGGVVALLVPFLFTSPMFPLLVGLLLSAFTYVPHATGRRLYWLQTADNKNDVKFTLMWGVSIFVIWLVLKDPFLAIIPATFMAFGDGVTGVARNAFFKRRTKSWLGNVFMVAVSVPLGYWLAGAAHEPIPWWGAAAAVAASYIEHFEFGPIDDNILITVVATLVLFVGTWMH